jgi:hypothetical protein
MDANHHLELLFARPTFAMQQVELVLSPTTVLVARTLIVTTTTDAPLTFAVSQPTLALTLQSIVSTPFPMEDVLKELDIQAPMQLDTASGVVPNLFQVILLTEMETQLQVDLSLVINLLVMLVNQALINASL